jgi:hypothetical protein
MAGAVRKLCGVPAYRKIGRAPGSPGRGLAKPGRGWKVGSTEIAPVGFVLPKSQKGLQVLRFTIAGSSFFVAGINTAGAVSRFDPFHVEINSKQGVRFIRSA